VWNIFDRARQQTKAHADSAASRSRTRAWRAARRAATRQARALRSRRAAGAPAAGDAVERLRPPCGARDLRRAQPARELARAVPVLGDVGDDERCRGGGRGGTHVGDQVADRDVGLVADAGDDRQAPTRGPRALPLPR